MKCLYFLLLIAYVPVCASKAPPLVGNPSLSLIVYEAKTESNSSAGSSGSSSSKSAIVERYIGEKDGVLELEYSFPGANISENDAWKFPARVLNKPGSSIKLLNQSEIKVRLESYLEKYPKIRKQCGGVVFTWTAFPIHCDVNHVIDVIERYNLRLGALSEGKLYKESDAIMSAPLRAISTNSSTLIYEVELILEPDILISTYKKDMEQVAAITGGNVRSIISSSLRLIGEDKPEFSGKRLVTIEMASNGQVAKLKRETITVIKGGDSYQETRKVIETLERRPFDTY
ncbi:hypothetical protein [uncultured Paraglaciecola sp.]|uniref:hypothetical protein n=1 Tax=uncultured Paraglaciecola sp. TaxID=1765024 RepID=UPI0025937AAB|nr:hypothetical protein [uncultured Paraglaciecola sp.]